MDKIFNFSEELKKYGLTEETYEKVLKEIEQKMSGCSDSDWDEIIGNYDVKCARDTMRKASQTIFGGYFVSEYLKAKGYNTSSTTNLAKAKELLGEQYITKQQIHNDKLALNRYKREFIPSLAVAEELAKIQEANNFTVNIPSYSFNPITENSEYTMIANISDWHIGYVIDNCGGNYFNWEIANERVNKYIEECKKYINLYGIKKVYVINTGDTVEHVAMRSTQQQCCEFLQSEQINKSIELIFRLLVVLSQDCEVIYGAVAGNHDRMDGDKKKNYEGDNANIIITEQVKNYVEISGTKRINVINNKFNDKEIDLNINGLSCKFVHGDEIPKLDKNNFIALMSSDNKFYDLLFTGHWHNFSCKSENHRRYIITTGCLSGFNSYSKKFLCSTNASQTICILGNNKVELIKDVILS